MPEVIHSHVEQDEPDPEHGTGDRQRGCSATDESSRLHLELIRELGDIRRCLQKWHAAIRRISGDAASDILRGQGRVLALLDERDEMRQRDMCIELGIRPQSLGEILVKLEKAGYVARRTSETDRRIQLVRITEAGHECINSNRPQLPFGDFTDGEIRQFLDYLARAKRAIDQQSAHMATFDPQKTRHDRQQG